MESNIGFFMCLNVSFEYGWALRPGLGGHSYVTRFSAQSCRTISSQGSYQYQLRVMMHVEPLEAFVMHPGHIRVEGYELNHLVRLPRLCDELLDEDHPASKALTVDLILGQCIVKPSAERSNALRQRDRLRSNKLLTTELTELQAGTEVSVNSVHAVVSHALAHPEA